MVWPTAQSGLHGFPRSCFCFCHIRDSSSWTTCSRGAWFRKTTGARKPMSVSRCRLHFDRFRWAKHETRVAWVSIISGPLHRQTCYRESFLSLMVLCHRSSHQSKLSWHQELFSRGFAMTLSGDDGSGPMLTFWKSRENRSLSQELATKQRVCSLRICKDTGGARCLLSSGKNGSLFGRNWKIVHRRCRHCSKARHRSSRLTVNRQFLILTQRGKKPHAPQMMLALPKRSVHSRAVCEYQCCCFPCF